MMKRKKTNRRRQNQRFDFQRLEPRQLLAGDVTGLHQVSDSIPTGVNIVINGDFENVSNADDNYYNDNDVTGWIAQDSATGQQLNVFDYLGNGNVLDIDSTGFDFDRVYQDVATRAGQEYLVLFDYRRNPVAQVDGSAQTNDFEVWWGGVQQAVFTSGDHWQTGVLRVTASNLDATRLLFCEVSEAGAVDGDGQGALLDNIRVFQANSVEVANGGFETVAAERTLFYRPQDVEGWGAVGEEASRFLKIAEGDSTVPASEGSRYLNLDSTGTHRDVVYRDLQTTAGTSYVVTFDVKVDGEQTGTDDELRVRWNDQWATTIRGTDQWQTYGLILSATSDSTRLTFLEPGETTGDGSGPLIDNLQISAIRSNTIAIDADVTTDGAAGAATVVGGVSSQLVAPSFGLTYPGGTTLDSVVITLNDAADGLTESLRIDETSIPLDGLGNPKIIVQGYSSATRQLELNGAATAAEYQAVVRTLAYRNTLSDPTTSERTIRIRAVDSTLPVADPAVTTEIVVSYESDQSAIDDAIIEQYIADNNITNAVEIRDGLYAVINEPGTGLNPTANSTVNVDYNGKFIELNETTDRLVDGASFDFSGENGAVFALDSVIRGWTEGIPAFKTGGSGQLLIPSRFGYGAIGSGSAIPGNTVLLFDVTLRQILS